MSGRLKSPAITTLGVFFVICIDKTTVRNIYTASTATWNYQQDISLERPTLWPIINILYIGIVPMDVIGLQKQCEMGCDLSTLGQTLRPRASQMCDRVHCLARNVFYCTLMI